MEQHEHDIKETIKLGRASTEVLMKLLESPPSLKNVATIATTEAISRGTTEGCLPLPGEQHRQRQQQQAPDSTLPIRESWPTTRTATRAEKENNKAAVHMLRSLGTMQDSTQREEDFAFDTTGAPLAAAAPGQANANNPCNPPPPPPTTLPCHYEEVKQPESHMISGKEQALLDIEAFEQGRAQILVVGKKTAKQQQLQQQKDGFVENIANDVEPLPSSSASRPPTLQSAVSLPGAHAVSGIGASNSAAAAAGDDAPEGSLEFGASNRTLLQQQQAQPERMLSGVIHASLALSEVDEEDGGFQDEEVAALDTEHLEEALDVVAMPADPQKNAGQKEWQLTKSKRFNLGCLALIVGVFFAVLFGVILKPNDDDANSIDDADPSAANTSGGGGDNINYHLPFDESLMPSTKEFIAEDPTSPQYKANAWMLRDPNLQTYPLWRKIQRFAMATKYYGLQGDYWYRNDNWLSYEVSECHWWSRKSTYTKLPRCDQTGHLVVEDLSSNNLNGTIPPETQTNTLIYVNNSNNHIRGRPPPMSGHVVMEVFDLSNNNLEGPMVAYGGFEVPSLRVLHFKGNGLEGKALMGFLVLANLEIFDATSNRFDGSLPPQVAKAPNLTQLLIGDNQFTGTLPSQLGLLKKLQQLNISGNADMSGTIPTQLGLATSLQKLDLSRTSVRGIIPSQLCLRNVSIVADCRQIRCC